MFTLKQSYIVMFNFLDELFSSGRLKKDSVMMGLMGDLSPYLFHGGNPADPAMGNEWIKTAEVNGYASLLAPDEVYNLMTDFLTFYHKKGFAIEPIIEALLEKEQFQAIWNNEVEKIKNALHDKKFEQYLY